MLDEREMEFERICAIDNMNFYSGGGVFDKIMEQYWMGVVTGIELIMEKVIPTSSEIYYGMKYKEYHYRVLYFFFNELKGRLVWDEDEEIIRQRILEDGVND